MGKEIINVLQTFSGNATVRVLGVLVVVVVLAFFMHKSKTFSGVWEFIANWWILLVFVSIETLVYFHLTNEKNSSAIKMFLQITPAITMTLFVGLLSRKTANDNRTLQEKIAIDSRTLQEKTANENQLIQQMHNLETRKSNAIIQLTSQNSQQMGNGVVELIDIAVEWDLLFSKYKEELDEGIVIEKIQNIINNVYKTEQSDSTINAKSNGIYTLNNKLSNFTLEREIQLRSAQLKDVNLSNLILKKVNLMDAMLDNAILYGANFTGARLDNASLVGAKLNGAKLYLANFSDANLTNANLSGIDLSCTLFNSSTKFTNADLKSAKLLDIPENREILTEEQQNTVTWIPSFILNN